MCLQWCHAAREGAGLLIDNDEPCTPFCERGGWYQSPPPGISCSTCTHRNDHGPKPVCGLTAMPLPVAGGCCHHNAKLHTGERITIPLEAVAPGVMELHGAARVSDLLDGEASPDGGAVTLALDDLNMPLVYGCPAEEWDSALGHEAYATRPHSEPEPIERAIGVMAQADMDLDGAARRDGGLSDAVRAALRPYSVAARALCPSQGTPRGRRSAPAKPVYPTRAPALPARRPNLSGDPAEASALLVMGAVEGLIPVVIASRAASGGPLPSIRESDLELVVSMLEETLQ